MSSKVALERIVSLECLSTDAHLKPGDSTVLIPPDHVLKGTRILACRENGRQPRRNQVCSLSANQVKNLVIDLDIQQFSAIFVKNFVLKA